MGTVFTWLINMSLTSHNHIDKAGGIIWLVFMVMNMANTAISFGFLTWVVKYLAIGVGYVVLLDKMDKSPTLVTILLIAYTGILFLGWQALVPSDLRNLFT